MGGELAGPDRPGSIGVHRFDAPATSNGTMSIHTADLIGSIAGQLTT
jgi:hypothetical protein